MDQENQAIETENYEAAPPSEGATLSALPGDDQTRGSVGEIGQVSTDAADHPSDLSAVPNDSQDFKISSALTDLSSAKHDEARLPGVFMEDVSTKEMLDGIRQGTLSFNTLDLLIANARSSRPDHVCDVNNYGIAMICKASYGLVSKNVDPCIGASQSLGWGWSPFAHGADSDTPQGDLFDVSLDPVGDESTSRKQKIADVHACLTKIVPALCAQDKFLTGEVQHQIDAFTAPLIKGLPDPDHKADDFPAAYGYLLPLVGVKTIYPELVSKTKDQDATESSWWQKYFTRIGQLYTKAGIDPTNINIATSKAIANANKMYPQQMQYTVPFYRQQVEAMIDGQKFFYPTLDNVFKRRLTNVIAGAAIAAKRNMIAAIVSLVYTMGEVGGLDVTNQAVADDLVSRAFIFANSLLTSSVATVRADVLAYLQNLKVPAVLPIVTSIAPIVPIVSLTPAQIKKDSSSQGQQTLTPLMPVGGGKTQGDQGSSGSSQKFPVLNPAQTFLPGTKFIDPASSSGGWQSSFPGLHQTWSSSGAGSDSGSGSGSSQSNQGSDTGTGSGSGLELTKTVDQPAHVAPPAAEDSTPATADTTPATADTTPAAATDKPMSPVVKGILFVAGAAALGTAGYLIWQATQKKAATASLPPASDDETPL
jgi:hypothetical protein